MNRAIAKSALRPARRAAVALLASCSVGPDYQKPPAETPDSFKELGDWKPAEPKAAASGQPWWSVYDDPVLDQLEKQVDISNQNLKASEAAYRQAVALVGEARAGYFPSIGLDPSATRSRTPGGSFNSSGSGSGHASIGNQFSLPVDASWVIDIWGQVRRQVESARATAQASAATLSALRLSEQATLAQDYFQLRVDDELKRLLDDTAKAYARTLADHPEPLQGWRMRRAPTWPRPRPNSTIRAPRRWRSKCRAPSSNTPLPC